MISRGSRNTRMIDHIYEHSSNLPIGFPTYCLVVTITLNVSRITELIDQCKRNTDESMWTCETLTKVFSLKNMSSMTQTTWRSHEVYFLLRPKLHPTFKFLDVKYLMCFTYLCVTWISLFVFNENGNAFNTPSFAFPSIYIVNNKTHQKMGHFSKL